MRLPTVFIALLALAGLTGCNTFDRRAQQKAEVFASLSPETRERLRAKSIVVGDSADLVFIALGKPDETRSSANAAGEIAVWTYLRRWQEYQGHAYTGLSPRTVTDPKTGAVSVYYEPVRQPVYATRQQPYLHIEFVAGKVSAIERAQD